jgi:2-polyprenyl-3-methyl-5-hydroxy-6-metoxy-1,4-benzoquinol methylase
MYVLSGIKRKTRRTTKRVACLIPAIDKVFAQRDLAVAEYEKIRRERKLTDTAQPLTYPPIHVETKANEKQLAGIMRHLNEAWKKVGENEPYFSVITDEAYKMANIKENKEKFFTTGSESPEYFIKTAERCGINIGEYKDCFELGCGVGRVTIWLARLFNQIYAMDISVAHLKIAKEAAREAGHNNIDYIKFDNAESIDKLPSFDVFISFIVLQHNPPPVTALLLEKILNKIRPNGIAYFQCQTYIHNYSFSVAEYMKYIASGLNEQSWEMHCVPQSVIFEIFQKCGFKLLEVREDNWSGTGISNSFLAQKQT